MIKELQNIPVNETMETLSIWFSGLDWNKTYWWRVSARNDTLGVYSNSSIYSFTTRISDPEPNITYYSLGSQIYVNPVYAIPEQNITYYSIGAEIPISKPYPKNPIPANNTAYGRTSLNFSVYIQDVDANDIIDYVEFYWANGTMFGNVSNIHANTRANVSVSGLHKLTWYEWYVVVHDGNWVVQSDTWRYRPANNPPVVTFSPANNSTNVAVYRKLVSGEWKRFVRLQWNMSDADGDGMNFTLYIKDPSTGSWIMRWQILGNQVRNGSYYQDEMFFNKTLQHYYWRLIVSDGINTTTYNLTFYTQFFIDFWWKPEYPTQEDTIQFCSITEGADNWKWDFGNGYNVTGSNETAYRYNLANFYNVTLRVYNSTNNVWGSLTKTIRVDRNVTLYTTKGHAGINYFVWHLPNETTMQGIAKNLSLSKGEWVHYYNKSREKWDSLWYGYTGKNDVINKNDDVVITVGHEHHARINTTERISAGVNETLTPVYNYVGWSATHKENVTNLTNYGLQSGDWVHYYDVVNGTWKSRWLGHAGDKFDIAPYDVIVTAVNGERIFNVS